MHDFVIELILIAAFIVPVIATSSHSGRRLHLCRVFAHKRFRRGA
jgi:hypothetical protein